jgi:hypothetical protein
VGVCRTAGLVWFRIANGEIQLVSSFSSSTSCLHPVEVAFNLFIDPNTKKILTNVAYHRM